VEDIDKKTSGEDRLFHFHDHLQTGYVYDNDGTVEGFYLPTLGDGLIIANKSSAGMELLNFHLKSMKVVLPQKTDCTKLFI
jgi:hypothetical protein